MSDIIINKQADGVFIHCADSAYFQRYESVNATGVTLKGYESFMLLMAEEIELLQAKNDKLKGEAERLQRYENAVTVAQDRMRRSFHEGVSVTVTDIGDVSKQLKESDND